MTMKEFLNHCTACGGNWVAMLLSGIEKIFPNDYKSVVEEVDKIGFGQGGALAFVYVGEWLEKHGIIFE